MLLAYFVNQLESRGCAPAAATIKTEVSEYGKAWRNGSFGRLAGLAEVLNAIVAKNQNLTTVIFDDFDWINGRYGAFEIEFINAAIRKHSLELLIGTSNVADIEGLIEQEKAKRPKLLKSMVGGLITSTAVNSAKCDTLEPDSVVKVFDAMLSLIIFQSRLSLAYLQENEDFKYCNIRYSLTRDREIQNVHDTAGPSSRVFGADGSLSIHDVISADEAFIRCLRSYAHYWE